MSQLDALKTLIEVKENSFIFEKQNALPAELCDDMIQRFEAQTDEQYQGRIGQTVSQDNSIKKTTDLVVSGKDHWKDVDNNLFRSMG
ncbi:MAG: 2OG-Fe(II) oxygenase, partial [Gammaproteobacteria bacterium]|nr:2OG-Fe(II) oxygenase [Gammaproteobacteria bacterium]